MRHSEFSADQVREFLEMETEAFKKLGAKGDSFGSFILKHGRPFTTAALPEGIKRGQMGECFCNATQLMWRRSDLIYCEGYAAGIIPVLHAWCVTKDGVVIDNTWDEPEKCGYFGIPFRREFVNRFTRRSGYYGLIDCPKFEYRLLTGKHKVNEWFLPMPRPPDMGEQHNQAAKEQTHNGESNKGTGRQHAD